MYYCQQRKLAFVMPSKTGSTTFEHFLKLWGTESLGTNRHLFYSEILEIKPDIVDYKLIGFFRDPLDRFLSMSRYLYVTHNQYLSEFKNYPETIYDDYVDNFGKETFGKGYVFSPQVRWLQNADLLNYSNYDMEILKVARMFGQTSVKMIKANETPKCDVISSQKVIDFVQSYYADDYRLGRERGLLA